MNQELICGIVLLCIMLKHVFYRYFFKRKLFDLADIAIWMACIYIGFGPVLSRIYGYTSLFSDDAVHGSVLLSSLIYISGIFVAQIISRNFCLGRPKLIQELAIYADYIQVKHILLAYFVVVFYRVYLIMLGGGFSGTDNLGVMLSLPYWIIILKFVFGSVTYGLIFFSLKRIQTRSANIFLIIIMCAETIYTFTQGRRDMINLLLIYGISLFLINKKINLRLGLVGLLTVFLLMKCIFPSFWNLRNDVQDYVAYSSNKSAFSALKEIDTNKNVDEAYLQQKYSDNIQKRSRMNYMWILIVQDSVYKKGPLYGEVIFSAFMGALPRSLRPTKYWFDNASVIQDAYNFPRGDTSDNFVAAGYADFKNVGVFINGLLIGLTLTLLPQIIYKYCYGFPLLTLLAYFHLFPLALDFEISPTSYFATLRSVFLLMIICQVLVVLYPKKIGLKKIVH